MLSEYCLGLVGKLNKIEWKKYFTRFTEIYSLILMSKRAAHKCPFRAVLPWQLQSTTYNILHPATPFGNSTHIHAAQGS